MKTEIYVASKTLYAPMWRELREQGYNIISTWIDEARVGQTKSFADLAVRCIKEASEADITIVFALEDEILKGTLAEIGAALASGKQVLVAKIEAEEKYNRMIATSTIIPNHPHVLFVRSLEEALKYVKEKEQLIYGCVIKQGGK